MSKSHNASANQSNAPGDSIILEEEIDPNYEPTQDEVIEYAKWLGMDLEADKSLLWIAREGLKAPCQKTGNLVRQQIRKRFTTSILLLGRARGTIPVTSTIERCMKKKKKRKATNIKLRKKSAARAKKKKSAKMLGKDKKKKKRKRDSVKLANPLTSGNKGGGTALDRKPLPGLKSVLGKQPLGSSKPLGKIGGNALGSNNQDRNEEDSRDNRKKSQERSQ